MRSGVGGLLVMVVCPERSNFPVLVLALGTLRCVHSPPVPHPPPSSCVVGDRIPETPEQTPLYLVFPLELAAEGRLATDYSALDDCGLDDRWLDDHWLYNRRLHDCGLRDVGLLAVLLHLDGAAIGLGIGVGDRLLLDSRLWPPVVLIDRVDAGGDGAADAADR